MFVSSRALHHYWPSWATEINSCLRLHRNPRVGPVTRARARARDPLRPLRTAGVYARSDPLRPPQWPLRSNISLSVLRSNISLSVWHLWVRPLPSLTRHRKAVTRLTVLIFYLWTLCCLIWTCPRTHPLCQLLVTCPWTHTLWIVLTWPCKHPYVRLSRLRQEMTPPRRTSQTVHYKSTPDNSDNIIDTGLELQSDFQPENIEKW
jgi:hypothetical protein